MPVGEWKKVFDALPGLLKPADTIVIKAYTDGMGRERYNDQLALKRAEFVLAQIKARGVKNPVEIEAKGKCCYVADNDTDEGRAANRRAEIHIVEKEISR